jgi:hypothetical protein
VLYTKIGLRVEGTLHLTAHHIIFKYDGQGPDEQEIWVSLILNMAGSDPDFHQGSISPDILSGAPPPLFAWAISYCLPDANFRILQSDVYKRSGRD